MENANYDFFLEEEFIEMTFDLEVKSMYTFKEIGYYWMNKKKNLYQNILSFVQLLAFSKFVDGRICVLSCALFTIQTEKHIEDNVMISNTNCNKIFMASLVITKSIIPIKK